MGVSGPEEGSRSEWSRVGFSGSESESESGRGETVLASGGRGEEGGEIWGILFQARGLW